MKMIGNRGFTLLELMVALVVGGIVTAAVFTVQKSQQDSYIAQEDVAVMQQNLRASLFYIEREVRLAGCNPTEIAGSSFIAACDDSMQFTLDVAGGDTDFKDNDNDGEIDEADEAGFCDGDVDDPNENVRYFLTDADGDGFTDFCRDGGEGTDGIDNDQDGDTDEPDETLVARNVDALNFVYLNGNMSDGIDNDGNGLTDEPAEAVIPWIDDATNRCFSAVNLSQVRAVQVTLLVRSDRLCQDLLNRVAYQNQMGDIIRGTDDNGDGYVDNSADEDRYRRRLLTTSIKIRNLNIE
jgi:type IV pilus assembly protein PilW